MKLSWLVCTTKRRQVLWKAFNASSITDLCWGAWAKKTASHCLEHELSSFHHHLCIQQLMLETHIAEVCGFWTSFWIIHNNLSRFVLCPSLIIEHYHCRPCLIDKKKREKCINSSNSQKSSLSQVLTVTLSTWSIGTSWLYQENPENSSGSKFVPN